MNTTTRKALRWTGISLAGLLVVLILVVVFFDWNRLKHPIERIASEKLGRPVTIDGDLQVHPWSWTPTVVLNRLTVGNPPWETEPHMAKVERLEIQVKLMPLFAGQVILPRIVVQQPDVYLHQEKSGRANWTFASNAPTNAPSAPPAKLPVVRDLLIESGKLRLNDEIRRLTLNGTVQAHEKVSDGDPKPFRIEGKGSINNQPFELNVAGGPLVNLDPQHPYPFDLHILAGNIKVISDGRVLKPFDMSDLDFNVTLSGDDLAEGFYLTQLALPNTPPFKLHSHIERHGMHIGVTDIAGNVGGSDLRGKLDIDASRKRPVLNGDLVSNRLRLKDLAASVGGRPKSEDSLEKAGETEAHGKPQPRAKAPPPDPNARLFPDARLQVDRVRAMDGDVHFRANSIEAGSVPLKQVAFRVKLDDGVLSLDPFAFEMPEGRLSGAAIIDARKDIPRTHLDVRVRDIRLDQLKGKGPDAKAPLGGVMEARAVIDGKGDSLHRLMSDANGMVTIVLPDGEIRAAFAELMGINAVNGVGLLLTKPEDRTPIRCGVAQFDIKSGSMNAQNVTFDTEKVLIKGQGDIQLGPEELNLQIKGEPKRIRFGRLRTPVGVSAGSVAKQGAVAAALGVLATPLAAIIAFVDPGLAKDQNCAQMLADVENKGPPLRKSNVAAQAKPPVSNDTKLR
jgi:uncharacterized protein involved in outer membrane biogenesis